MATTVTNNTIQGRNFHWLDSGNIPQSTFISGETTVQLSALTGSYQSGAFKSAIFSAIDQARTVENTGRALSNLPPFTDDFTVA